MLGRIAFFKSLPGTNLARAAADWQISTQLSGIDIFLNKSRFYNRSEWIPLD